MSGHTPAPWVKDQFGDLRGANGNRIVGSSAVGLGGGTEERVANGRLFDAAGDLLEALISLERAFVSHTQWSGDLPTEVVVARAVIAKATGQ